MNEGNKPKRNEKKKKVKEKTKENK